MAVAKLDGTYGSCELGIKCRVTNDFIVGAVVSPPILIQNPQPLFAKSVR
jgi:hypothetical protein